MLLDDQIEQLYCTCLRFNKGPPYVPMDLYINVTDTMLFVEDRVVD